MRLFLALVLSVFSSAVLALCPNGSTIEWGTVGLATSHQAAYDACMSFKAGKAGSCKSNASVTAVYHDAHPHVYYPSCQYYPMWGISSDGSCPSGQVPDPSGLCVEAPPELCPEKGTKTDKTYEITLPWNGDFCLPVYINGCPYNPCGKDTSVSFDDTGNNCESFADSPDLLTCYFKPESMGPIEPCTGDNCPDSPPAVEESKPVGTPETSTETKTDPSTGATTTTETEKSRQVNPDGTTTETNTTTTVTSDSNGTTTTVRTDTTTRNPNGSTTTTTTEQVTGPDGVTKTTISGSTQQGEGLEERGGSECDPESKDYLQCVGMLEEIGDSQSADLISEIDQAGNDVIDNYETAIDDLFSVMESPEEPSAIVDLVNNFIPSSSGCNDFGFTWNAHTFTVPCSRLAPLREWFGWLLSVLSVISIFYIALRPQTS